MSRPEAQSTSTAGSATVFRPEGDAIWGIPEKMGDFHPQGSGYFDRQVFADEGCTDNVIEMFDHYIKERGQRFLEEIDVWFSTNEKNNLPNVKRKNTGFYMVHYVDDGDERAGLREVLFERGVESDGE